MVATACAKFYGLGGIDGVNTLQLAHCIYDLQKQDFQMFKDALRDAADQLAKENPGRSFNIPETKMLQPVTTRWWWLGISLTMVLEHWHVYRLAVHNLANVYSTDTYLGKVVAKADALMKEEELYRNIWFLSIFCMMFINPHFYFLQSKGLKSKKAGFRSPDISAPYFLMRKDLVDLQDGKYKDHNGSQNTWTISRIPQKIHL